MRISIRKAHHVVLLGNFDVFVFCKEICETLDWRNTNKTSFQTTNFETRRNRILQKRLQNTTIILKNITNSFKFACAVTTGFDDCHKLILSSLRAHFKRLLPKELI